MTTKESRKIFNLACDLAHNMNAARNRGAKKGGETYADGVFNACELALKELHNIYGDGAFQPVTRTAEDGRTITLIFGGIVK